MSLFRKLHAADGIMRTREIMDAGWSRHTIDRYRQAGRLIRPQRGWIALPDTDPELLFAAEHGVVLSCMSVVARRGLWVPDPLRHPHIAARTRKAHVPRGDHVCHWGTPVLRREPHALVDRIENALIFAVSCLTAEGALAVWESALRTGAVTRAALEHLPLRRRERELLDECTLFSDSGLESYVLRRLRRLRLRVIAQALVLGHRVDFLIDGWLVLQIDGGHHVGPQRDEDNWLDAQLLVNGIVTIRVSQRQVDHDWPSVQNLIMTAISQGAPGAESHTLSLKQSGSPAQREPPRTGRGACPR